MRIQNKRLLFILALLAVTASNGPFRTLSAQQPTTLNFVNARLADVIRSLAVSLGVNVVLSEVPETRITFTTAVPVPASELAGVLESILESNGLVLVQKGAIAQVMPAEKAPTTGAVRFGTELGSPPPLGLVTQLVPLQSIRADEAAAALRQVAGPRARIEPVARSNALLITDMASNLARYLELVRRLDEKPQGEAGLRTYVVPLKYANSEDLAASLGQLYGFNVASRATSLSDRSLSRNLDIFREREAETFRLRQNLPTMPVTPGDSIQQGALIGRTTVVPDPPTNSLMIRTAPPNFPLLNETIQALDTRPAQVLFEVTVAEITLGKADEFGIDWSVVSGSTNVRLGTPAQPDTLSALKDFIIRVVSLDRANVRAVLRALASTSNVRVLSTPEILAVNNREARIVVGSRIPFVASTRLGDFAVDRSVQYEDVGTTLTIIPTINQDDYVSVQILQEVNSLTNQVIAAALDAPVISTREASTRAIIRDGQTVVIGGLIGDSRDYLDSGIPFLKDIPLLGNLFKRRSEIRNRTELAIFVTPYIVRTDADADAIRERIRGRMNQDTLPPIRR
ncbi:MAG: secretin N-terminal domain-containing protein [Gemmatimonadota bacterium]